MMNLGENVRNHFPHFLVKRQPTGFRCVVLEDAFPHLLSVNPGRRAVQWAQTRCPLLQNHPWDKERGNLWWGKAEQKKGYV